MVTPGEEGVTETPVLDIARIRIPGRHNVENFMTAIALTCGLYLSFNLHIVFADGLTVFKYYRNNEFKQ